ncbi:MAG: hypothetical protein K8F52_05670 [Candidatus Scalindua rubra]|nr:hypothetical protein [Candidatus Scalindua rubra]
MNSIRPRKSIFESSNVTSAFINNAPNETVSDGLDRFYNPSEQAKPARRDFQSLKNVETHLVTPGVLSDNLPTNSMAESVVEDFAVPMDSSNGKTSKIKHPELSTQLSEETQLDSHAPQQAIDSTTKAPEPMEEFGNTPNVSEISTPSLIKDVPSNYQEVSSLSPLQSYVKDKQEIKKPVPPSKIEKTNILPIRQTIFSKVGSVIKKAAIQPETKQTVKINIGKVEVRAAPTQQPHTAPPSQKPARSGFGDYLLVRNYGFSEH